MNPIWQLFFYFFMGLLACQSKSNKNINHSTTNTPLSTIKANYATDDGFAVLELFTSEGCSSCPPAEKLANEIAKDADENAKNIFVLAFHVDYWNRLGWQDRFSSPQFTERQYWYAKKLINHSIYTPQMIVNGQEVFVGSNRNRANATIQKALSNPSNQTIKISLKPTSVANELEYDLSIIPQNLSLNLALLEKNLYSDVTSGENEGRKLFHYSVVSQFQTIDKPTQKGILPMPNLQNQAQKKHSLIVFLQNTETLEIVAAKNWKF
jgi:hypothetical protein